MHIHIFINVLLYAVFVCELTNQQSTSNQQLLPQQQNTMSAAAAANALPVLPQLGFSTRSVFIVFCLGFWVFEGAIWVF